MFRKAVGHRYEPRARFACFGISSRALGWNTMRTPHIASGTSNASADRADTMAITHTKAPSTVDACPAADRSCKEESSLKLRRAQPYVILHLGSNHTSSWKCLAVLHARLMLPGLVDSSKESPHCQRPYLAKASGEIQAKRPSVDKKAHRTLARQVSLGRK